MASVTISQLWLFVTCATHSSSEASVSCENDAAQKKIKKERKKEEEKRTTKKATTSEHTKARGLN